MATFLAHIRVHAGREAEFERTAAALWAETHAHEPNVRRYEYWRGASESTYYTLGSWADYPGFIAHQVSDHHTGAGSPLRELIAEMRLEWVDPLPDASGLNPTEMSTAPDDATELAASYYRRQPAEIQHWWGHTPSATD